MLKSVKPPAADMVGADEFRAALRQFASGVTVISSVDPNGRVHGMTATAFTSLSLDPPLVLVAIAHGARCHRYVTANQQFGVSILHEGQGDLSKHFGGKPIPGRDVDFPRLDGVPVVGGALVQLACTLDRTMEGGDHTIFIGRVRATRTVDRKPLIHFAGSYRTLSKDMN